MQKGLSLGLMCAALSSTLWAGGMGPVSPNWSGFYIGGNLGDISTTANMSVLASTFTSLGVTFPATEIVLNANRNSFIGGAQLGYNWQNGLWIIGTELFLDGFNLEKKRSIVTRDLPGVNPVFVVGDNFSISSTWQFAWLARLGMAIDNWFPYFIGGVAVTDTEVNANFIQAVSAGITRPASSNKIINHFSAGTIGIGTEYALTPNWRIGAEYRYTDYGNQYFNNGVAAVIGTNPAVNVGVISTTQFDTNQIIFKVNYLFA